MSEIPQIPLPSPKVRQVPQTHTVLLRWLLAKDAIRWEIQRTKARTADKPFGSPASRWEIGIFRGQIFMSTGSLCAKQPVFLVRKRHLIQSRVKKNTETVSNTACFFLWERHVNYGVNGWLNRVRKSRVDRAGMRSWARSSRKHSDLPRGPRWPRAGGVPAPRSVYSEVTAPTNSPDYRASKICFMCLLHEGFN